MCFCRYEDTLRPVFAMFTAEMLKTEEEDRGESKPQEEVIGVKKPSVTTTFLMLIFESIEWFLSYNGIKFKCSFLDLSQSSFRLIWYQFKAILFCINFHD